MSITVEGVDRPIIIGETNLPDGTVVMVTLSRTADGYAEQDITSVQNGGFRAGPFEQHGRPLSQGLYDIQVMVPVSWMQPQHVQAVIGRDGERLEGPFVRQSDFLRARVIEYHQDLPIGDPFAAEWDRANRAAEQKKRDGWLRENYCRSACDRAQSESEAMYRWFDWQACYQQCLNGEP
ncbi:MAG: hypothetical protein R3D05_15580 [Dongiaceae bacterium]